MIKKVLCFLLLIIVLSLTACNNDNSSLGAIQSFEVEDTLESVNNKTVKVILLYGQSNATGVAKNEYLSKNDPEAYDKALNGYNNVLINFITENGNNSSNNKFVTTKLGEGYNQNHFGPEIGIADTLSNHNSDETYFIIKYSWGGSILHNQWLNSKYKRGELYNAAMSFTITSLNYLKSKGYIPKIAGVCWMQGESDAVWRRVANKYYKNTKNLVSFLREDLEEFYDNNLLFIDAGIKEIDMWKYHKIVNNAKKKLSEENIYNIYFSTQDMSLTTNLEPIESPDLAHYDSLSMLYLGRKFASYIED